MFLTSTTLASLRFFEAAARLASFKRAATELHVTQGAVSQHVKHLEEALGCRLFYRLPRQVTLTEEGKRFAAVVGRSLEEIESEARTIAAAYSRADIRLRVGPSFALRWLVPRLGKFYARYPHTKIFVSAAYGELDPSQREFDLAIEMMRGKLATLECEMLMDEYLVPVCSPAYCESHPLKTPADLAKCTLLHDGHAWVGAHEDAEWQFWLQQVGAGDIDSKQGRFFSLANMSIEAALAHQGVAMGRLSLVSDLLRTGQLVAPLGASVMSPMKYCLVYPKEVAQRSSVETVIRWLRAEAKQERAG